MKKPKSRTNHCFSVYYHPSVRYELKLGQHLAKKTKKSLGAIMRLLLKRALKDNGLMDDSGDSLVPGIQSPKKEEKKSLIKKSTSLKMRDL
jgi:hypothetical protein